MRVIPVDETAQITVCKPHDRRRTVRQIGRPLHGAMTPFMFLQKRPSKMILPNVPFVCTNTSE